MKDIKQCPYCGGKAEIDIALVDMPDNLEIYAYVISCLQCGHDMPGDVFESTIKRDRKKVKMNELVEQWNNHGVKTYNIGDVVEVVYYATKSPSLKAIHTLGRDNDRPIYLTDRFMRSPYAWIVGTTFISTGNIRHDTGPYGEPHGASYKPKTIYPCYRIRFHKRGKEFLALPGNLEPALAGIDPEKEFFRVRGKELDLLREQAKASKCKKCGRFTCMDGSCLCEKSQKK